MLGLGWGGCSIVCVSVAGCDWVVVWVLECVGAGGSACVWVCRLSLATNERFDRVSEWM
jgi:hypothetical protein